jgi:hypothetical protein
MIVTLVATALWTTPATSGEVSRFVGFRALVVEPENSWGWDSAVFGALQERGFEVEYAGLPTDAAPLRAYDLIALSIKRSLTPAESKCLRDYVQGGGTVYGSWGGPFGSPGFFREVCKVGSWRSVRLMELRLLDGPLTAGIGARDVALAEHVGHSGAGAAGWETGGSG